MQHGLDSSCGLLRGRIMNSLRQKSTRKILGAVSTVLALAIGMLLNPPGMTYAQSSADLSSSSALSVGASAKTANPSAPQKRVFSAKESYIEYVVEEQNARAAASSRGSRLRRWFGLGTADRSVPPCVGPCRSARCPRTARRGRA